MAVQALHLLATNSITVGGFKWSGNFTTPDLIAASTNALNGALLARRPDHYKQYTVVGILLMAILGGIGGGVTRDVLVAQVPVGSDQSGVPDVRSFGTIGFFLAYASGQLFREGLFQFVTSFCAVVRDHRRAEGRRAVGCRSGRTSSWRSLDRPPVASTSTSRAA